MKGEVSYEPKEEYQFRFSSKNPLLLTYSKWHIALKIFFKSQNSLFFRKQIQQRGWMLHYSLSPGLRFRQAPLRQLQFHSFSFSPWQCPKTKLTFNSACHVLYSNSCFLVNTEQVLPHALQVRELPVWNWWPFSNIVSSLWLISSTYKLKI